MTATIGADAVQQPAGRRDDLGLVWSRLLAADPRAVCVRDRDGAHRRDELEARAAELARRLSAAGPAPDVVAVLTAHGAATVVAVLGVLRAGSAYLCVDPGWPDARIDECLRALGVTTVVADRAHQHRLPAGTTVVPLPDRVVADGSERPAAPPAVGAADPHRPAYLLFTSGSTGRPKAVAQSHHGVLRCARNQCRALGLTAADRLTLLTPFGYDMAAVDLWSALVSGAELVCHDLAGHGLAELPELVSRTGVTVFHCAPTVLRALGSLGARIAGPAGAAVRLVLLGGEAAVGQDVATARRVFGDRVAVAVGYGSSEASFSTMLVVGPEQDPAPGRLPLGPVLPGFAVDVVPSAAAPGEGQGEIVVSGSGVALGYRGTDDPAVLARFTPAAGGTRAFRTGDLAVTTPAGPVVLGRLDRQLSVRGNRVDAVEVEARLRETEGVAAALVGVEQEQLVATVTVVDDVDPDAVVARARRLLAAALPSAAVPARFVVVDALGRTATGKALPVTAEVVASSGTTAPAAGPADDTGLLTAVRRAVADELGVADAGVDPDRPLHEQGVHSLGLARVHAVLAPLGTLALADLVDPGTPRSIADRLSGVDLGGPAARPRVGRGARSRTRGAR